MHAAHMHTHTHTSTQHTHTHTHTQAHSTRTQTHTHIQTPHTQTRTHTQALTNSFGRESSSHSCSSSAEQELMLSVSLFFSATSSCSISSRRLCRCSFIVSLRSCRCASSRPISPHTLVNCSKMGELSSSLSTAFRQVNSSSTEALEEMFSRVGKTHETKHLGIEWRLERRTDLISSTVRRYKHIKIAIEPTFCPLVQIKIESTVAEKIREGVDRAALLSNIQRFSKITDLIGELSMTSLHYAHARARTRLAVHAPQLQIDQRGHTAHMDTPTPAAVTSSAIRTSGDLDKLTQDFNSWQEVKTMLTFCRHVLSSQLHLIL